MSRDSFQYNVGRQAQRGGSVRTLREQVLLDLTERFAGSGEPSSPSPGSSDSSSGRISADLVISKGVQVAVVEIKIGDPELPLPSSTSSRMHRLRDEAERSFSGKDIIEVLVTNYSVIDDEQKAFKDDKIKIVLVAPALSRYNRQQFFSDFDRIVWEDTPVSTGLDTSL